MVIARRREGSFGFNRGKLKEQAGISKSVYDDKEIKEVYNKKPNLPKPFKLALYFKNPIGSKNKVMNIEHTWPQSEGARGDAKSDLHHLFATTSFSNSMRGSLPLCNVTVVKWEADQSKSGLNEFSEQCFEPPQNHKGNVTRALFCCSLWCTY